MGNTQQSFCNFTKCNMCCQQRDESLHTSEYLIADNVLVKKGSVEKKEDDQTAQVTDPQTYSELEQR